MTFSLIVTAGIKIGLFSTMFSPLLRRTVSVLSCLVLIILLGAAWLYSQGKLGDSYLLLLLFNQTGQDITADYIAERPYQRAYLLNPEGGEQRLLNGDKPS